MVKRSSKTQQRQSAMPPPQLEVEIANRLRDPFETAYMGVLRTNDPLLLERGGTGPAMLDLYRDLKRDGKVFSGLQRRALAVIGREWQVEPIQDDAHGTSSAEAVTKLLKGFNFDQLCRDLMDALLMGFVPAEIVWTIRDNLVAPKRVIKRAQRRFVYVQDDENKPPELRLLTRENLLKGVELPDRKFLVHRLNPEDDNPYGTGLGLQLYWPVYFKRAGVLAWNQLNDRFGSPTAWGKYPRNASPKEKNTLFDALRSLKRDGTIATPEGMEIELLESKLTGSISTQQGMCEYMDDWIMEVILGQSPRSKGGGALAAASNEREDVRLELSQADSDLLSETINSTLLAWTCEYNGFAPCRVYRQIKKQEDLKASSETDKNVSEMGFAPSLDGVRAKYGEHWDKKPEPPPAPPPGALAGVPPGGKPGAPGQPAAEAEPTPADFAEAALAERTDPTAAATDLLADAARAQWSQVVNRLQAIVNQAQTLEEVQRALAEAYGGLERADLQRLMGAAFALAELKGMDSVPVTQEA